MEVDFLLTAQPVCLVSLGYEADPNEHLAIAGERLYCMIIELTTI